MEYPHGAIAAGGIPFTLIVDSGWPERHGVGVGGRAADGADRRPRHAPSPAGQTPRWVVALCAAVGARLGPRQAGLAAAAARHPLAGLLPAFSMGDLEAAGDSFVLDARWDRKRRHPPMPDPAIARGRVSDAA